MYVPICNHKITLNLPSDAQSNKAADLLDAFKYQARKEKWHPEAIDQVQVEALKGDYNYLLQVLQAHCKEEKIR